LVFNGNHRETAILGMAQAAAREAGTQRQASEKAETGVRETVVTLGNIRESVENLEKEVSELEDSTETGLFNITRVVERMVREGAPTPSAPYRLPIYLKLLTIDGRTLVRPACLKKQPTLDMIL
jgi:hypothetical protein